MHKEQILVMTMKNLHLAPQPALYQQGSLLSPSEDLDWLFGD